VAEVSYDKNGGVRVRLYDKIAALDKLMKHIGGYQPDRHEISGPGGKPIETKVETTDEKLDLKKLSIEELQFLEGLYAKASTAE
jgi:hypothetical protein